MKQILFTGMPSYAIDFTQSEFLHNITAEKENLKKEEYTSDIFLRKPMVSELPAIRNQLEPRQLKALQLSSPVGWANRIALAIIYIWFGLFKLIDQSPAEGLVTDLQRATFMHYVPINIFLIILGIAECFIGVLWLFPKLTKLTFSIFSAHIITTFLPLFFLPNDTWTHSYVLTMQGQYIVKNIVLVACAVSIFFDHKRKRLQK